MSWPRKGFTSLRCLVKNVQNDSSDWSCFNLPPVLDEPPTTIEESRLFLVIVFLGSACDTLSIVLRRGWVLTGALYRWLTLWVLWSPASSKSWSSAPLKRLPVSRSLMELSSSGFSGRSKHANCSCSFSFSGDGLRKAGCYLWLWMTELVRAFGSIAVHKELTIVLLVFRWGAWDVAFIKRLVIFDEPWIEL